jgi:hypothetical protein
MFLFGNTLTHFKCNFNKYFLLDYDCKTEYIRIRDKITKSCVLNIKLPFIISECNEDLLNSLYIQIFKYDSAFHLRYEQSEFKLFKRVYNSLNLYYKNIIQYRNDINIDMQKISTYLSIEHSNNLYFNRKPSDFFLQSLDCIDAKNKSLQHLNIYAIQQNQFLIK